MESRGKGPNSVEDRLAYGSPSRDPLNGEFAELLKFELVHHRVRLR